VLAEVTPPVALSAYAASSVMMTDPIETGVFAARVALPKYFIGITFILSLSGSAILILPVTLTLPMNEAIFEIISRYALTILAVFYLNVGVIGYLRKAMSKTERIIVGAGAVLLFYPSYQINLIAGAAATIVVVKNWLEGRGGKMQDA